MLHFLQHLHPKTSSWGQNAAFFATFVPQDQPEGPKSCTFCRIMRCLRRDRVKKLHFQQHFGGRDAGSEERLIFSQPKRTSLSK